jgi:hypothetical protein
MIVAGCSLGLAAVAVLGLAVALGDGLPIRYPEDVRALMTPLAVSDFAPEDVSKNIAGPLLVMSGDSHSVHLLPGLGDLQKVRVFRLRSINWTTDFCGPIGPPLGQNPNADTCRQARSNRDKAFEQLKPDIVVVAAYWSLYPHIEMLHDTLQFLRRIGVRRNVVIGQVPTWPRPPQELLYEAYIADPSHKIPDRLSSAIYPVDVDKQLRDIASVEGATFISAHDVFCNDSGCLARLGATASDLVQFDTNHLTAAASRYLVSRIANQIFD